MQELTMIKPIQNNQDSWNQKEDQHDKYIVKSAYEILNRNNSVEKVIF